MAVFAQVKAKREDLSRKTFRVKIIPLAACHFRARCLPGFRQDGEVRASSETLGWRWIEGNLAESVRSR
jgi:hypothetical protein